VRAAGVPAVAGIHRAGRSRRPAAPRRDAGADDLTTTLLLVRHAEPEPARPGGGEQDDRRLSEAGRAAAADLAAELTAETIAAIYSSPYPRALETVEPLAAALGLPVVVVDDLRERLLSPDILEDWLGELRRSFADSDYAPAGGESSRQAGRRVGAVLDDVAARHRGQTVVCASHGNLLALALRRRDPEIGFEFWRAMPMPALYRMVVP
jgi:2,3-bisphosphoglycerate-dependent phosphoglycerate mutase